MLCSERLAASQVLMGDGVCVHCRELPLEFARAVSFGEYQGELRGLIHLLKYNSVLPAAPVLGGMLSHAIAELLPGCVESAPLIVPVPLHRSKRSERGFNQAELIARAAAKELSPSLEVATGILVRDRATRSQVGLTRQERLENLCDAFCVADPARIVGRNVIVVDDVMTTGTTVSECARVLKDAGANRVWAATVARAFSTVRPPASNDVEGEERREEVGLIASV